MGARRCGVSRLCAELAKCVDSRKNGRTFPLPIAGWSSLVARQAHNLKVAGSNPAPAPNLKPPELHRGFLREGAMRTTATGGTYPKLSDDERLQTKPGRRHPEDYSFR